MLHRFGFDWFECRCDAVVAALEALSGVTVLSATNEVLQLQLMLHINPSHPYQQGALTAKSVCASSHCTAIFAELSLLHVHYTSNPSTAVMIEAISA